MGTIPEAERGSDPTERGPELHDPRSDVTQDGSIAVWCLAPLTIESGEKVDLISDADPVEPPTVTGLIDSTSESVERLRIQSKRLGDQDAVDCSMVERHFSAGREYLSAVVLVPVNELEGRTSQQRLSVERACRDLMDALVASIYGDRAQIVWINRTLVVPSVNDPALTSWISSNAQTVQESGLDPNGAPYLVTSWGNGMINEAEFMDPFIGVKFREGMIDAQTIWLDLEEIAEKAEKLVEGQIRGEQHVRVGDGQTESLLVRVAKHNLVFDEVLLDTSAVRSAIATAVLDSWKYPLLRNRVDQRVRDADALAQRRRLRREARYESRVSNVLLILSIISSVQLILAVVALAYSGSVQDFPGRRSESVVAWIRFVDADLWLLVTFLAAGLLYAFVALRRRL